MPIGGRAKLRKIKEVYSRQGLFLYKVRYVIDNREESDIDDPNMKAWVAPAGRPTRPTHFAQEGLVTNLSFCFTY